MRVAMPTGAAHGWGIAGENIAREISLLPQVPGVTLHCIARLDFEPRDATAWDKINIGYCFFEHEIIAYQFIPEAAKRWDFIVAGSRWCEYHLRLAGMDRTTTILQGVDQEMFRPAPAPAGDRFVVFSGGKFEFRKGQDLVIAAMKIFMERHQDVWLTCAWHNSWPGSISTMMQSEVIQFINADLPCEDLYRETLRLNGIDLKRTIIHPVRDNAEMAAVYAQSHLGLFPNRCEGGNNMVMCEYMACGRTVIASGWSGHADVLTPGNAFLLEPSRVVLARVGHTQSGVWFEPSVQQIVDQLEAAYRNRQQLETQGLAAAQSMKRLTWAETARRFHGIARHLAAAKIPSASTPDQRLISAERAFEAGLFAEAEQGFRELLAEHPLDAALYNSLGTVLDRQERYNEAEFCYHKSLALDPSIRETSFNLANTLKRHGKQNLSRSILEDLTCAHPDFIDAWQNLAVCYADEGLLGDAIRCLEEVVSRLPQRTGAWTDLGELYRRNGDLAKALECYDAVARLVPTSITVLNGRGLVLHELERYDEAEGCFRQALAICGDDAQLYNNLGVTLLALGRVGEAQQLFRASLSSWPGEPSTTFNLAMTFLAQAKWQEGWEAYEARFSKEDPVYLPAVPLTRWGGESLRDRTILVRMEQGYGDTVMFARFLPLLEQRGARIILQCLDSVIQPLAARFRGVAATVLREEALPAADFEIPICSLPRILQPSPIPFPEGYLVPPPELVEQWRNQVDRVWDRASLRVGLVWSGRKTRLNANRSLPLEALGPLFRIDGIQWFVLQTGPEAAEAGSIPGLVKLSEGFRDFSDTAAAMSCLDLIISIDTASAHVAGALGIPLWVLLKKGADWRWMADRVNTPWYTSVCLFRQRQPNDWNQVVSDVEQALRGHLVGWQSQGKSAPKSAVTYNEELIHQLFQQLNQGNDQQARDCLARLEQAAGVLPEAHYARAVLAERSSDIPGAMTGFAEAIRSDGTYLQAYNALGMLHLSEGNLPEAQKVFEAALSLSPGYPQARANLAVTCRYLGDPKRALGLLDQLISEDRANPDLRFNRAITLLSMGRFTEGWDEYEWRFRKNDPVASFHTDIPRWKGEPLKSRTLLVHAEQGYGDTIQFSRYVVLLIAGEANVVFECQDNNMAALFRDQPYGSRIIARGEQLPRCDLQVPLLSLPRFIQTLDTCNDPYLRADEHKANFWQRAIGNEKRLRVGIAWGGRREHAGDKHRSIPLQTFKPLWSLSGVAWYSLQTDEAAAEAQAWPVVADCSPQLGSFSDTAGLIECLDLVISVDSAVAHLAGALGKPIWILISTFSDWRWGYQSSNTPWYSSAKLFRQQPGQSWDAVVASIFSELKKISKA